MEKRLTCWKERYLLIGGRIVLLKYVLSSLPLYFLSVFKCPAVLVKKMESIQIFFFLWNDDRDKRKFHLVAWPQVCKSVKEGGLGIRPLRLFNIALLGKAMEIGGEPSNGLWKFRRASGFWKGVGSISVLFNSYIRYRAYFGEHILF